MQGQEGGVVDTDDEFARKVLENSGAFILGRNMFGPVRGPGWTTHGRAGGATILRTMRQPSF
jgi:hypothetical protein